ncbi:glycosyltransferase [Marispirochaeta sp.]|uniref:glycosyltransferase n=1 Tax=Marispirochaeta sp. TaxID=2038653 RepID=UPI0029C81683|nr:glycosyltransferase [Marispirochaeta sp.]
MSRITVLSFYDRISAFHSLKPFLFSKHRKLFRYTRNPDYCLKRDRNRVLFMDRWFLKPDKVDMELLKRFRDKYETIFFFNGNAGGGILRPEVLPYVDLFFNKSLFKNKNLYKQPLYGDEIFTDYIHKRYGIEDPDPMPRKVVASDEDLAKLKVSWNIGIGDFPKLKLRQRSAVAMARITGNLKVVRPFYKNPDLPPTLPQNKGTYPIQARWGGPKRPTLLFHREQIIEKIKDHPDYLTGRVEQNRYNDEIKNCKITLSPFGWGEVCFRDFEAVLNASLLLKPDMSHMETWPDIFFPGETYVPIDWDATDLLEKGTRYLEDDVERERIVRKAFEAYTEQAAKIEERVEEILGMVKGCDYLIRSR